MPSQPRFGRRKRGPLFWDDDFEPAKYATEKLGTSLNPQFEGFLAWFMRRPGAELPERLPQDLIDEADADWAQRKAIILERTLSIPCPVCKVASGSCKRGKGKGRQFSDQIHMPRVIAATGELEDEVKERANAESRAKAETSSDDE